MTGWLSGAALSGAAFMAYAVRGRSSSVFGKSFYRGPADRPCIALTYDDGPGKSTPQILDLLDLYSAKATFFQCGAHVARLPAIAREVLRRGHEIGNHTYDHPNLAFKSRRIMREQLARTQAVIAETSGVQPKWFRAPYGVRWPGLGAVQAELGLTGVMWTVIGRDWKMHGAAIAARISREVTNGGIVCLHDGRELIADPDITSTIEATRQLLPLLQSRGYRFVTISELLCPTTS